MLWLSLGENCLTDDILRRHGKKSFSTPYSPCRSNIDYALALEERRYAGLLDPENLVDAELGGTPVVRSSLVLACDDIYDGNHIRGFEFTHHDPVKNGAHLESFQRKVDRMNAIRGVEDVTFLYHHRRNWRTDLAAIREKLGRFASYYRTGDCNVRIVLFYQTIVDVRDRAVTAVADGPEYFEFDFRTADRWDGSDQDVFWARVDDDLIAEMIDGVDAQRSGPVVTPARFDPVRLDLPQG